MLTQCPECRLPVSDKALNCPHCGYPIQSTAKRRKPRNKNHKRRRLPNGFGQISEIKNRNLRKPFRAMVTVGKTPEGRPISKPLKPESYFETYNDAYLTHSTLSIYTHFIAIQCLPAYDLPGSARRILWMDASDLHFCASAHQWHISACLYNREFLGFPVTKY
mgnify:CR=1 FL=1